MGMAVVPPHHPCILPQLRRHFLRTKARRRVGGLRDAQHQSTGWGGGGTRGYSNADGTSYSGGNEPQKYCSEVMVDHSKQFWHILAKVLARVALYCTKTAAREGPS